jgi:hypothetical protein
MNDATELPPEIVEIGGSSDAIFAALYGLDGEQLMRRPAPGEWSAWDIAYHVAQIEVWYFAKLCEAAFPNPADAMRAFVLYWRSQRQQGLAVAGDIPLERLDTPALLGGVPEWTPRQLLERMAAHDREHADQATTAWTSDGDESALRLD